MSHPNSTNVPSPATIKRPTFGRPVWPTAKSTSIDSDFFDRSDETLATITAKEDARRRARLEKKHSEVQSQDSTQHNSKKLKREEEHERDGALSKTQVPKTLGAGGLQTHSEDTRAISALVSAPKSIRASALALPNSVPLVSSSNVSSEGLSISASTEETHPSKQAGLNVVDLEVPGNDFHVFSSNSSLALPDELESDEEFADLARHAREKARNSRLRQGSDTLPSSMAHDAGTSMPRITAGEKHTPQTASEDSAVTILITSRDPNVRSLKFQCLLGQRLKDMRLAWCKLQQLSPEVRDTVVLVWRGNRLYDATTCRSLGIDIGKDRETVPGVVADIIGGTSCQIHMEAMTLQEFHSLKKQKSRGAEGDELPEESMSEDTSHEQIKSVQLKIILRGKGFPDLKLLVKPVRASPPRIFQRVFD